MTVLFGVDYATEPGRAVGKKPASKAPVSIRKPALASTPSKHSGVACTASDTGDETAAGEDSVVVPSPSQSGTGSCCFDLAIVLDVLVVACSPC